MENIKNTLNFKDIGNRIRQEREKFALSRERFAEILDLSPFYIGQIERGERKMSLETLFKVSNSLNMSIDFMLLGSTAYMETLCSIDLIENNYKEEMDIEIKELLSLLSGSSKENIHLIKEITKLILPYKK